MSHSGGTALNGHNLMVLNLMDGLDHYIIPTMERVRTFPYTITRNVLIQVAIIREKDWVVSGGDDGFARIYDSRTGRFLQRLDQGSGQ